MNSGGLFKGQRGMRPKCHFTHPLCSQVDWKINNISRLSVRRAQRHEKEGQDPPSQRPMVLPKLNAGWGSRLAMPCEDVAED